MSSKLRLVLVASLTFLALGNGYAPAYAADLNKNEVIASDETLPNSISASDIQAYLTSVGSELATYTIPETYDVYYPVGQGQWDVISVRQEWQPNDTSPLEVYHGKTIAQLVYDWSMTNRSTRNPSSPGSMNPLIALATLDKESGSITGGYRSDIITNRPITTSWLMGYGFNDRMANCVRTGDCDVDYNRQRALWYGGPGQQIVEGTSALKRWSANPTLLSSCSDTWHNMRIQGECLNLANGISYALYRYTPTFSGNQLFLNLYTRMKAGFGAIETLPPPPVDEAANDTTSYSLVTYATKVSLTGVKAPGVEAWFREQKIATASDTSYDLTYDAKVGKIEDAIEFRRTNGSVVNRKPIIITRHKTGDVTGDGNVNIEDLSLLATYWGHTDPQNSMTNLNPDADNVIDIVDLSLLASNWNG